MRKKQNLRLFQKNDRNIEQLHYIIKHLIMKVTVIPFHYS